jgi:hypothetical protein
VIAQQAEDCVISKTVEAAVPQVLAPAIGDTARHDHNR